MKKVLLGATALTAAGAFAVTATPAQAEFDMSISGWQNNAFVFTDAEFQNSANGFDAGALPNNDGNASGMSMYNSSEINFFATQKLDNGLTIVSRIELESSAAGNGNTDEVQVHINGGFGSVELGGIDTVNDNMHHGVPSASLMGLSATSYITYLGITNTGSGGHLNTSWNLGGDDALGVAYYTPRIAGFQAGVSYSPNVSQGNGVGGADNDAEDFMSAGLNFTTEMSGVGLNASVAAARVNTAPEAIANNAEGVEGSRHTVNWGVNASYMGFGVGFDMAHHKGRATSAQSDDATVWQLGAKYGQGPWAISYGYLTSKGRAPDAAAGGEKPKTTFHEIAGSYNLGPGVDLGATVATSNHVGTAVQNAAANDDTKGLVSTVWLGVSF